MPPKLKYPCSFTILSIIGKLQVGIELYDIGENINIILFINDEEGKLLITKGHDNAIDGRR